MYDIIIIGAGTAGMTAAIYAVRANKKVLVIEELMVGGQIVKADKIENYPGIEKISGADFAMNLYGQATAQGAEFLFAPVSSVENNGNIKTVKAGNKTYECKAIIIATGSKNKPLGIDGEKEFLGKGVSYCATCDGAFFKNKTVCVVGGGNTAGEDALYLSDLCEKVYLINNSNALNMEASELSDLKSKGNIEILENTSVVRISGKNTLEEITIKDTSNEKEKTLKTNAVFVAIGHMPGNQLFSHLVDLDEKGYIIAEEYGTTKTKGVFVAGDCRNKKLRQLTTAASDGANAATSAILYIKSIN